jgi:hypothetical protein
MSDVERAQADLEHAQMSETYDQAVEAYRKDPTDENKAKKDDLADQLVAKRQTARMHRDAATLAPNDGVARPEAVEGSTEVNQ